jgi:hypothetical protein
MLERLISNIRKISQSKGSNKDDVKTLLNMLPDCDQIDQAMRQITHLNAELSKKSDHNNNKDSRTASVSRDTSPTNPQPSQNFGSTKRMTKVHF